MPHPAMTGPEIGKCDHEHHRDIDVSWNVRVSGTYNLLKPSGFFTYHKV